MTDCGMTPPDPTTRFNTALLAEGWMNWVSSPAPMEKPCHSMMVAGPVLVMDRALATVLSMLAPPYVTRPPTGFASPASATKQAATATTKALRLRRRARDTAPSRESASTSTLP